MGLCSVTTPSAQTGAPQAPQTRVGRLKERCVSCFSKENCCNLSTVMKVAAVLGAVLLALTALTFVPQIGASVASAFNTTTTNLLIGGFAAGGALAGLSAVYHGIKCVQERRDAPKKADDTEI